MKGNQCNSKSNWLLGLLFLYAPLILAQTIVGLNLEDCQERARQNYPLIKSYSLLERSSAYSISILYQGILPQFKLIGHATHQSDVTQIPLDLPAMELENLPKDQYGISGEVSQSITELFTLGDQREFVENQADIEAMKTDVALHKIRERINALFFGILLLDRQIQQTELLKENIQSGIDQANIAFANGLSLRSDVDGLKVELLKIDQRSIEIRGARKGYADMLSLFIGQTIGWDTPLIAPVPPEPSRTNGRPELKLFDLRDKSMEVRSKLITARNLPRFDLFFRGGYGRPGLNMLDPEFQTYSIGGLRLSWDLGGLYTLGKEKKVLGKERELLDLERQAFLFNTDLSLRQMDAELEKLRGMIQKDDQIVAYRQRISRTLGNQLKYGTATSLEYIEAITQEDLARQNSIIHRTQLLMTQYKALEISGN